jgi:hypothetical protein
MAYLFENLWNKMFTFIDVFIVYKGILEGLFAAGQNHGRPNIGRATWPWCQTGEGFAATPSTGWPTNNVCYLPDACKQCGVDATAISLPRTWPRRSRTLKKSDVG